MAFTVPQFNLAVDVYSGPWVGRVFRFSVLGNLSTGRASRSSAFADTGFPGQLGTDRNLLVPALTDIRDISCNLSYPYDIVECPSGSGRWYAVGIVDDVAKGFANEYRMCYLTKIFSSVDPNNNLGLYWPTPIP
jgi:hypothetical protein